MGIFTKKKEATSPNEFTSDMIQVAQHYVEKFEERFPELDYSKESLESVEIQLEELSELYFELEEEQKEYFTSTIGTYLFEVARKEFGGAYFWSEKDNQPILVIGQPEFEISFLAIDKVKSRIINGPENNIPFFYKGVSERIQTAKKGEKITIM